MAWSIPNDLSRFQAVCFACTEEVGRREREAILRCTTRDVAEMALSKIMREYLEVVENYKGRQGETFIKLDVYVLSPEELHLLILDARTQGRKDAMVWHR
jgi:hypothetical protein